MVEESLSYLTRVIKNLLEVLQLFFVFLDLLEFPRCRNSFYYNALLALRLQHLKQYWQKIWKDKKHLNNQTQNNQSINEWRNINFFCSDRRGVRDTNCIPTSSGLSHTIGHKMSIEKNKLHNETFRYGHTNLTLPCSGKVTEMITKQYTHTSIIIIIIP